MNPNKNAQHGRFMPSQDLLLAVRAGFVAQGLSLNAWCTMNGVRRQRVEHALLRSGKRSAEVRALRERVCRAAGLSNDNRSQPQRGAA